MAAVFRVDIHPRADKELDRLSPCDRSRILTRIEKLGIDPHPRGHRRLSGISGPEEEPVFRIRVGDFRILYIIRETWLVVIVIRVGQRKDIYQNLR
jgi:mRNA interferase RelE/StbE